MTSAHHLALATDHGYARHAATVARSAVQVDPRAQVHLLCAPDVTTDDRARLQATVPERLTVHQVAPGRCEDLPTTARLGPVMWYRLLLPELLPDVRRVLYVDADTLVVDRLDGVFTMDLAGSGLAAVDNVMEPARRAHVTGLGLAPDQGYFNSGVLLLDLDVLRAQGAMGRVAEVARGRSDLAFPDQDALNLVLGADRRPLHPRWNAQNSLFAWPRLSAEVFGPQPRQEAVADPAILHFEGPGAAKPWHRASRHPWRGRYRELAATTDWGPLLLEHTPWPHRLRAWAHGARARVRGRGELPS